LMGVNAKTIYEYDFFLRNKIVNKKLSMAIHFKRQSRFRSFNYSLARFFIQKMVHAIVQAYISTGISRLKNSLGFRTKKMFKFKTGDLCVLVPAGFILAEAKHRS